MTPEKFCAQLKENFPFEPTKSQLFWFSEISEFILSKFQNSVFLLKGYAGTGKTTLIGSLVRFLKISRYKTILMAPTGRAAKVLSTYSGCPAFTIHKQIYHPKTENSGKIFFQLKPNKFRKTIFIADEASMIGDDFQKAKLFENGSLLNDLIDYVSSGDRCKLVFVGDPAQLPPINLNLSPALDPNALERYHFNRIFSIELDRIVRQKKDSGILNNATRLREQINLQIYDQFQFEVVAISDILYTNNGMNLFDTIKTAFDESGIDQTIFIVRSNKRANLFNNHIRKNILGWDDELCVGDQLMVVKNNYFWLASDSKPGFIANGDVIEVLSIKARKEIYDFSFAEVRVRLVDYPEELPFETVLLLDTLKTVTPSLSFEQGNHLYQKVLEDYDSEKSRYKKFQKVKQNLFFNALQVKYSYAITCHKSQGGQWEHVFIEKPFLPQGPNKDYLRWLYTAITRAKKNLYLIGFPKEDFKSLH